MPFSSPVPEHHPVSILVPSFPDDQPPCRIIPEECSFTNLHANSYEDMLELLVQRLAERGFVHSASLCLNDLLAREGLASTMLENGVALPRARTAQVSRLLAAVATGQLDAPELPSPQRIVIILTLSPKGQESPLLPFIAHVARVLLSHPDLEALRRLQDPTRLRAAFI